MYVYESLIFQLLRKQPSIKPSRTVCPVEGCSGDCLEASDQPVVINQLDEVSEFIYLFI